MTPTEMLKAVLRPPWRAIRTLVQRPLRDPDRFLGDVRGVIHVGANDGGERDRYRKHGLRVLWIEPIPDVFERLQIALRGYERQRAARGLVTDMDGHMYDFHVASNNGSSSSIYDLKQHKELWPDISYTKTIRLESTTLPTLLEREGISPELYDALVLDTQGSELLVLRGASSLLGHFRYVKTEVADFEAYDGCCRLDEVAAFMTEHGYREISRTRFAGRPRIGSYYDIVYRRLA